MKKIVTLTTLAATVCTCAVFAGGAETNVSYHRQTGPWVEANAGSNLFYLGIMGNDIKASKAGMIGWGWNANAGYNFTPYIGLEGGYTQLRTKWRAKSANTDTMYIDANVDMPYGAFRFTIPMGDRFALLGKLGAMYLSAIGSSQGYTAESPKVVVPYTGVGASYAITKNLDFSVQYQGAMYFVAGAGLLSGGLAYHF